MATLWMLPLQLLLLASTATSGYVDSGFLLVAPKVWRAGSRERLCVTLFNIGSAPAGASVSRSVPDPVPDLPRPTEPRRRPSLSSFLGLLRNREEKKAPESTTSVTPQTQRLELPELTKRSYDNVRVTVGFASSKRGTATFKEDKQLPADRGVRTSCFYISVPDTLRASYISVTVQGQSTVWSEIRVEPKVLVTLVQTDKAKYRPGQTVKLRVVSLRQDFTALDDAIKEMWITAPEGTRLAQWLNVQMDTGLVQKEFKLAQEPPLGRWTIHVKRQDGAVTKQPFTVQEYVPPRFELSVTAPGTIYRDSTVLTVKVCAKYTFGKPLVSADVQLEISVSRPNVFQRAAEVKSQTDSDGQNKYTDKTDNKGCASIYIVLSKIRTSTGAIAHDATQYLVRANVTEASTDISQVSEIVVPVRETKLFKIIKDESPKFFKPGLEYYGTVRLERQDGSPVKEERIEICYRVSYYRGGGPKSTSNSLPFIIRNIATSSRPEHCDVYRTDTTGRVVYVVPPQTGEISHITFKGRALGSGQRFSLPLVRGWYSPSASFLMIDARALLDGGRCGQTVSVAVRRSASLRNVPLQYLVLSRGDVIGDGLVRAGRVRLTLRSKMAPSFRLLVYAVTEQGEVVADSKVVRVAPCLPNKVSVSWSSAQVKPGDTASLTVTGSPGSLCGVDAVDRSTQLLGTSNTVSVQKVFSRVSQLVIREQALPRLTRPSATHCARLPSKLISGTPPSCDRYRGGIQRGIRAKGYFDAYRYRIPYEERRTAFDMDDRDDSVAAFDAAGFLAVGSLALQTRPCVERIVTVTKYKTCRIPRRIHLRPKIRTETTAQTASRPLRVSSNHATSSGRLDGGAALSSIPSSATKATIAKTGGDCISRSSNHK